MIKASITRFSYNALVEVHVLVKNPCENNRYHDTLLIVHTTGAGCFVCETDT